MSVLIKGMEMPECCDKCPFKSYVGVDHLECKITGYRFYVWEVGWGDGTEKPYIRHESCPLIELHPHGDLIDRDALVRDNGIKEIPEYYEVVRDAPTVIPAEPCNDLAKPNIDAGFPPSIPLKQVWTELFGEDGE